MKSGRTSLSLSSVICEVKSHAVSTRPAIQHRRISSTGEEDTPDIENVKGILFMIQLTFNTN